MMKNIKKSLVLGIIVDKNKHTDDNTKLDSLRDRLLDRAGGPVGLQTMALPLSGSTLLTLFSYMMWQVPLWSAIFHWLGWPGFKVFAGILPAALVYILIVYATSLFTTKGYLPAFKAFLAVTCLTALGTLVNVISAVLPWLAGSVVNYTHLMTAALAVVFSVCGFMCLNSAMFYRTMAFCLHNHVWRRQLKSELQKGSRPTVERKP